MGLRQLLAHYQKKHYQKSVQEVVEAEGEEDLEDGMAEEDSSVPAFTCRLCEEGFGTREDRFSHEILIHNIKNKNARLECKYCHKLILTFNGLAKHIRKHEEARIGHGDGDGDMEMGQDQDGELGIPNESLNQVPIQANAHSLSQSGGLGSDVCVWTCRLCPQVFSEQLERLVHVRNHTNSLSYQTNLTGNDF